MFGWGKDKAIAAAAHDFVVEIVSRADIGYRVFLQDVLQTLVDSGLNSDTGIGDFVKDDRTKWHYVIGVFSVGLMAPSNLLAKPNARKFTDYAIDDFCKANRGPIPSQKISRDVRMLLRHCIVNPMNSRVAVLFYMLDNSGLNVNPVKEKILASPIRMLSIEATIMSDGCAGAAKNVIEAHNLR